MQEANQEIYLHFKVFSSITLATATICCIGDWSRYDDADAGDDVDNDFLSFSSTAPINTTSTSSIPSPRSSTTSSTTSSTPTTPLTPSPTTPLTTSSTPSPTSTPS